MRKKIAVAGSLGIALFLPLLLVGTSWSFVIRIVGIIGIYMILALGLNFVIGWVGLLDLGFTAFYALGAYTMALLSMRGWGFWSAMAASVVVSVSIRIFLGAPVLRLRGDYLAVVTLGFGEITRIVLNNWDSLTNGPKGLSLLSVSSVRPITLFGLPLTTNLHFYYLILGFVLAASFLSLQLKDSRLGRAWIAIREDEVAAELMGVPVTRLKMLAFALSAAWAGVAGAIFARWENFVTPESFTFWESALLVSMVVLGGMGSVPGVLLGVVVVSGVPELLRNFLRDARLISSRYLLFGIALVVVSIFRPQGIFPSRRRERELGS